MRRWALIHMLRCCLSHRILLGVLMVCGTFSLAVRIWSAPPTTRPAEGLREHTPSVYALTGGRIVLAPGDELARGTVVIREGRIESVGEDVALPPDATVIDVSGRTIYPGLMDAYSEVDVQGTGDRGAPYWNSEVHPEYSVAKTFQPDSALNEKYRRQGIVLRLVAPNAGIFKGTSALVTTAPGNANSVLVKSDVALHVRLTVPFVRGGRDRYPNSPMGAVALARQAMYDAQWYGQAHARFAAGRVAERPEKNDALEVLKEYPHSDRLVVADTSNELFCLRAAAFANEFSLRLALRGSGNEYRRLEAIRALGVPIIVPVDFPRPPDVATPEAALNTSLESLMHWDHAPENPARLAEAGVFMAFSTDGLRDLNEFLPGIRKAVARGLDKVAALRALTTAPAELFGIAKQAGTIEPGKAAHLVITSGDLFESNTKIVETWVDGQRFVWDEPRPDPRGKWKATLKIDGAARDATFDVNGSPEKLSATLRLPPMRAGEEATAIKATRIAMDEGRLAMVLPGKDLRQEGSVRLSVVVAFPSEGRPHWTGFLVWPDGSRQDLTAERIEGPPSNDATGQGETKKESESAAAMADSKQEAAATERSPTRASFPVNYPLGAFGRQEIPEQPKAVLFTNATIWTCGDAGVLRNASLLIGEGKILAVGPSIPTPPDAIVVDATGKHLTPGLIDCHSHMATDGGVNESGQAITAEVRIGDFIDCDDITIYRQLAGGVTSANILHGSANPIGGQNQVIKLRWGQLPDALKFTEAPPGIKFALGENVKQSNWSERTTRYPQTRMGVEQIIRDEFLAAAAYARRWAEWARSPRGLPPRRDLELDAIAEVLAGTRWIHCHSYRQDEILALLRTCEEFHVQIGTLQHILEGYKVADEIARHGAMASSFSDWWAYKFEVYDAIPYNGALMHRAGIVVSFNSDDRELARHLNHEAAKAVKYGGVPPAEALKFVTLNPARQLRIEKYVGSLEPGKQADLVVWSGSPLSTLSRCEQTWIDGRRYFDRQEDAAMRREMHRMREALIQKVLASGEKPQSPGEGRSDPSELWPRDDLFCHRHEQSVDEHRDASQHQDH